MSLRHWQYITEWLHVSWLKRACAYENRLLPAAPLATDCSLAIALCSAMY